MPLTTYDDIFKCFMDNCRPDNFRIPSTNEGKYRMIKNGIMFFNNKMDGVILEANDLTETVNSKMTNDELLILAYCMRYNYFQCELDDFISVYSMFQKEIGFKDYKDQLKGREFILQRTEQQITELISNIQDKNIM